MAERFIKPTDQQILDFAIVFNDGKLEKDKIADMVAMCTLIISRLYENGDILKPTQEEEIINTYNEADDISDEDLGAANDMFDKLVAESKKRKLSDIITQEDFLPMMEIEKTCDPTLLKGTKDLEERERLLLSCIASFKSFRYFCQSVCENDHREDADVEFNTYYDNYREYLGWEVYDTTEQDDEAYYNS